ncbi:MAG TPA: hypothetical protein DDX89_01095 [Candidatus Omnitrophica bacterium]|nr:MAG: hypothetical protein A2Z92_02310 [Omnitrophica WOR_2 bacterium GWA2_63_20]HBH96374.1 hypothetical protein [Candidatus Omnitrophota bacterium]HBQ37557.1 hypothetical protein [Candidatus Omnitrophota bacterium]
MLFTRARKPAGQEPMTVAVKQPQPCHYVFTIHLKAQAIQPVREAVIQEVQREATIAGFRKGKAPKELVAQHHPTVIREETLRRLTRQVVEQVATDRKLKPVGPFEVTRVEFDETKGMQLEAQVEVEPEFALGEYRRIPLKTSPLTVTPDEVAQALARLQDSMAQLVPVAGGDAKEKRLPALDDELAKDVGHETLEHLKSHLEAKLREQKQARLQQDLESQVCEALLARHQFDLPQRLVGRQTERLKSEFQARLVLAGTPEEQAQQELIKYEAQVHDNANRHVKLAFILERLARAEGVSVTQDEVVDRLWKLSQRMGKDPAEVRRALDAKGLWPSVLSSILQDKTMKFLLDSAHVEEVVSGQ